MSTTKINPKNEIICWVESYWVNSRSDSLNDYQLTGLIPSRIDFSLVKKAILEALEESKELNCICPSCFSCIAHNNNSFEASGDNDQSEKIQNVYWFAYFGQYPMRLTSENIIDSSLFDAKEEWKKQIQKELGGDWYRFAPWFHFWKGLPSKMVRQFILDIPWGKSNFELREIQYAIRRIGWFDEWIKENSMKDLNKINYPEFDKVASRIFGNKIGKIISSLGIGINNLEDLPEKIIIESQIKKEI